MEGGGWIEIFLIACYGGFVSYKMLDPKQAPKWRIISWVIFSFVFFSQLILGIFLTHVFLMTGKLHLPIPVMILAGPLYRSELSVMTILFISTIILTGPAWCSHLCYFGAIDGAFANKGTSRGKLKNKIPVKITMILLVVFVTLLLRWLKVDPLISLITGVIFGAGGIVITILFSRKLGKMIHCTLYCPIGSIVNYFRYINPFRLRISQTCSFCMACSEVCRYDALSLADITLKKPDQTCTLCGDCLSVCHTNAIHYKLFKFNPVISRKIYLFLTVSLHSIFLALAKM